jgi:hypothetical protein
MAKDILNYLTSNSYRTRAAAIRRDAELDRPAACATHSFC